MNWFFLTFWMPFNSFQSTFSYQEIFVYLWRGYWKHWNVGVSFFMEMVVDNKDKKGRKKEKEGKSFGRLPSFFLPLFLLVSHNFECPNNFEFLKLWIILLFGRWDEFKFIVIRVRIWFWISQILLTLNNWNNLGLFSNYSSLVLIHL